MGFLTTLGQVGGGAAKTYFDNNLSQKWRAQQIKDEISKAVGRKEVDTGVDDPALWDSSLSPEQRSQLEAQTGSMGLSRVGDRSFSTPHEANVYADQYNSLGGQYGRAADVYAQFGEVDKSLGLRRDKQQMDNAERAAKMAEDMNRRQEQQAAQQGEVFARQQADWAMKDAVTGGVKRAADAGASVQALGAIDKNELLRSFGGNRAAMDAYLAEASGAGSAGNQARMIAQSAREAGDITTATTQEAAANAEDAKSATMAYDALRSGDIQKANVLWNSRGTTGQLIVPAGKNKKGEALYNIVDLKSAVAGKPAVLGTPATPDQLILQHMPLEVRQKMNLQEAQIALLRAQANDPDLRTTSGGGETAASFQREMFNNYVADIKRQNPKMPDSQAKTLAYAKMRDDYTQRDATPAKPMSVKDEMEAKALLAEDIRVANPKMSAPAVAALAQRELDKRLGRGANPASNPYAGLTDDSAPSKKPTAPGLTKADPNAAYMERFEKWKAAKERYEHFAKQNNAAGMAHWKPIMDSYK